VRTLESDERGFYTKRHESPEHLADAYMAHARVTLRVLRGDVLRSLREGKSLAIEGLFLSPELLGRFLTDECRREMEGAVVVLALLSARPDQCALFAQRAMGGAGAGTEFVASNLSALRGLLDAEAERCAVPVHRTEVQLDTVGEAIADLHAVVLGRIESHPLIKTPAG
jgi:hypothetical protein